jgi:hypothetical protein
MNNLTDKGLFDFKTVIILLIIFVLTSITFLVILQIDLFVNADLYEYGLQFSTLWANGYWYNKNMLLVFFAGVSSLSVLSMIPHFDYSKKPTTTSKWTGIFLPIISVIYLIFSMVFFTQVDNIIQNILPQYDLIINYVWTAEYWNLNTIALTLMITSLILLIIPAIEPWKSWNLS